MQVLHIFKTFFEWLHKKRFLEFHQVNHFTMIYVKLKTPYLKINRNQRTHPHVRMPLARQQTEKTIIFH